MELHGRAVQRTCEMGIIFLNIHLYFHSHARILEKGHVEWSRGKHDPWIGIFLTGAVNIHALPWELVDGAMLWRWERHEMDTKG